MGWGHTEADHGDRGWRGHLACASAKHLQRDVLAGYRRALGSHQPPRPPLHSPVPTSCLFSPLCLYMLPCSVSQLCPQPHRSRARFQLGGDLLVRDLAVLRPGLAALGLGGVPMHGSGMPDGRDLMYLPFVEVDVSAATGAGAGVGAEGGSASNGGSSTGGAGAAEDLVDWDAQAPGSGSRYGAAGCSGGSNSSSVAARLRSAGWEREREREEGAGSGEGRQGGAGGRAGMRGRGAVPEAEPVQLPFPLLSQLEVHGAVWMKSRFRALANLRGLQELRVSGGRGAVIVGLPGLTDLIIVHAALECRHVTRRAFLVRDQ